MDFTDNVTDEELNGMMDVMEGGGLFEFHLVPTTPRQNWRNVVDRRVFNATLTTTREPTRQDNLGEALTEALHRAVVRQIREDPTLEPHHRLHFVLQTTTDTFRHPFQSATFTVQEFQDSSDRLNAYLQTLAGKLNSNESFDASTQLHIDLTFIRTPAPGRGHGKRYRPATAAVKKIVKTSIVVIKNDDDLCCARAIVTMKAWADEGHDGLNYRNLRLGRPIQTRLAQELHRLVGVPEGPCGLEEVAKFQAALPGYQIKVMTADPPYGILYKGPESSFQKRIMLIKSHHHYDGCNSFSGFLDRSYYCHDCDNGYDHESFREHPCDGKWCACCRTKNCLDFLTAKQTSRHPKASMYCDACRRPFFGNTCMSNHLQVTAGRRASSLCAKLKKCATCAKHYDVGPKLPKHKCGWSKCPYCTKRVDMATHKCYIQPEGEDCDAPRTKTVPLSQVGTRAIVSMNAEAGTAQVECDPPLLVYADYEAVTSEGGLQSPIMVCAESEEEDDTHTFYGPSCTEEFFDYLDELCVESDGDDRSVIVLFHNLKGYDGMFILQHLYLKNRDVDNQITVGVKLLSVQSGHLTFKDSLCFLPFLLASFPSTFGLTELKKGFFPHLFNTMANQDYLGPMPPMDAYDPEGMSPKKKQEFEMWYSEQVQNEYEFNMRREMEEYCISDVKLLKAGCQKFQAEFYKEAEFHPMEKCLTIASACHRYWRKKLLTPKTIAVEPPRGWHGARSNQSLKAFQWLAWKEHQRRERHLHFTSPEALEGDEMMAAAYPDTFVPGITGDFIRHAHNGGEVRIEGCLVDGYDKSTDTVYEFHGCLWHGCTTCFPHRTAKSKFHPDRTFGELREATEIKENKIEQGEHSLHVMWECQWDQMVKTDTALQSFLTDLAIVSPLEPRDAFFGGRTNAATLHHEVDESIGEEIRYVDVTSLYPTVNKYDEYPIGHPTILTHPEDQDIAHYFGLAKVDALAPRQLYHPVLPHRSLGKLTFPLCRACVTEEMPKPFLERSPHCSHDDSERLFTGTWCTPELMEAVKQGYQIVRIHEVWHFPPDQRRCGLFATYVNTWLRLKQESSGYPSWAQTPEQKAAFVEQYRQKEGISLNPATIVKNPGRKATSKLSLNSFWGKFGENLLKSTTTAISTPAELYAIVSDPLVSINAVRICTEDKMEVVTTPLKEDLLDNGKVNIFIAAFTTCHARLRLYTHLETLGDRALYYDTDSVIYHWQPGQAEIPLGDYLGEMTNELDDGDHIVNFTSAGPKNYGYVTKNGKVCCKVRGFTLNNKRGHDQLNYEVMRQNLLDELQNPLDERRDVPVVNPHFFTRDPATKDIRVKPRTKQYGLVFDKRVVDPVTFRSYPYGYGDVE